MMSPQYSHAIDITKTLIDNQWWHENAPQVCGTDASELMQSRIEHYFHNEEGGLLKKSPNYSRLLLTIIYQMVGSSIVLDNILAPWGE
jgi:hypothetical protein